MPLKCNLPEWHGILEGRYPAFILGNGPSILEHDLSTLSGLLTIGTNRIYDVFDPIVLFWQDQDITWEIDSPDVQCSAIMVHKVKAGETTPNNGVRIVRGEWAIPENLPWMKGTGCSGVSAASIALAMKPSALILLGMDGMYAEPDSIGMNGPLTDFWGTNYSHTNRTLDNFEFAMNWLRDSCPVPVYNCGWAKQWPERNLAEVLAELQTEKKSRAEWFSLLRAVEAIDEPQPESEDFASSGEGI